MHAKNFVIDEGRDRHAVEHILELLPDSDAVAALALIIEAIDAVDLTALVVTAQEEKVLLELYLVREEQDDGLERVFATIDIVAKEEVVGFRREPTIFEEPEQVRKLTMSIAYIKCHVVSTRVSDDCKCKNELTADFYGCLELQEDWLLHKNLASDFAKL